MRSMYLSITVGIIISLMIGFIVPSAVAMVKTYPDDGIWEDTFEDSTNLNLPGCNLVNGGIELKKGISHFMYNFSDKLLHYAYAYQTFLFFPIGKTFSPKSHLSMEAIFEGNDINKIKRLDQLSATRSTTILKRFVIQHFRFQLNSAADAIDNITVSWYGKATNKAIVKYYFWNSSKLINGAWQKLGKTTISQGNNITFSHNIKQDDLKNATDADNYIDICVVAYFRFIYLSTLCNLSTNYIKLYSTGEQGYTVGYGFAETKNPIDPLNISTHFNGAYWDTLTWDDYQSGGATIKYQILYENNTGHYPLVPNNFFTDNLEGNNSDGFSHPPVYLNAIPYEKLKIRANLSTDTPLTSPRIFSWAMTWQNSSQWQDLFSTSYRIEVKNKVHIGSNIVNISRIQGEWPMVGFNSENNRATTGDGPSASSLYWYGNEYVGGQSRNPVIGDGKVYIVSNTRTIYKYNMELPSGVGSGNPQTRTSFHSFDYDIVNSPAVTDDYIVVATGQMDTDGHINHIYALAKDNISKPPLYDFSNNNIPICYFSSPVIAGDKVFITSWGGDTDVLESNKYTNNKILAVDLLNDNRTWQKELSSPSFSTPAVSLSHNIVIAGCNSPDDDSVYAFSLNGSELWSEKIGAIGYASPVIYENTVFVTATITGSFSIKTMLYALNLTDGEILWNKTICSSDKAYSNNGNSTPAIFDNILYVASPDGTLFALHASDGSELWATSVYNRSHLFSPSSLTSSPVYADGKVYLGLPSAKIIARIAASGAEAWGFDTFQTPDFKRSPVFGSPIVSNGLLFVADENGDLYSIGTYKAPSQQINGSITSIPIKLPESYWWYRFYEYAVYNQTISGITFKLLDENNNVLRDLQNGTTLPMSDMTLPRTLRLRADFKTKNISANNPSLFRWRITLTQDSIPPYLNLSSITPTFNGWLNIVVPGISIKVKDSGTGLLVNSAQYILQYVLNNITYTNTYSARCTGTNGTTQVQNITANLSAIPDYDNITSLKSITFSIKDLAGNSATKYIKIKQDSAAPSSYVKKQTMKPRYDASANFIWINASSFDNGTDASGIKQVKLYYRYSSTGNFSGDWVYFANSTRKSPNWKFNFTNNSSQHGGYFEVCTVAIDNASNIEEYPTKGDVSFLYDWKIPDLPSSSGDTLWFKERPTFSLVFEDDFRLDTIQYYPNLETSWTTIATDVNASTYGKSWSLKEEYWDQMNEGEVYYLYFKINDTLGNTLLITSDNQAITIRKDTSVPIGAIEIPTLETEMSWSSNFTVSGLVNDQDGSGIKEVSLYYRFSEDNSSWSNWTAYGDTLDSSPFEWDYTAAEGDGYYEFKINVTDIAGNEVESEVFPVVVTSFPTTLILVMISLVIVLSLISAIIFIKWRKRK